MVELTCLGEAIAATPEGKEVLDGYIKNVLAYKPILAHIFKDVVEECKDLSYEEITNCIERVCVNTVPVNPGLTNDQSRIEGKTQESFVPGEGKVIYDIATNLLLKSYDEIVVKILVDVEAQKDYDTGYDVMTRGIFYSARMISSQLGVEFTNSQKDPIKYGNIKKVYSIWICTSVIKARENTIERCKLEYTVLPKGISFKKPKYDLIEVICINLAKDCDAADSNFQVIRMLSDLLNKDKTAGERIQLLKDKYNVPTTKVFEKEVETMTDYAASLMAERTEERRAEKECRSRSAA
jgi:hypothetical protein